MKKQEGLKNLSVSIALGLIVGACSPMAPSVSKLSNASTQKTNSSEAISSGSSLGGTSAFLKARSSDDSSSDEKVQETLIQGPYEYKSQDLARIARPSMELDKESLDELTANGTVQFGSNDPRVKGREDSLSSTRLNIILAMHAVDPEKLDGLSLDEVQLEVKWHADTSQWEVTIVPPSTGDGNTDVTKYNKIRDILRSNLTYVAIEFKTQNHQ